MHPREETSCACGANTVHYYGKTKADGSVNSPQPFSAEQALVALKICFPGIASRVPDFGRKFLRFVSYNSLNV